MSNGFIHYSVFSIMSAMEFYNDTCSLCGRSTSNSERASEQVIDGTRYFFDTTSCLTTFKKCQEVYGKTFPARLVLTT